MFSAQSRTKSQRGKSNDREGEERDERGIGNGEKGGKAKHHNAFVCSEERVENSLFILHPPSITHQENCFPPSQVGRWMDVHSYRHDGIAAQRGPRLPREAEPIRSFGREMGGDERTTVMTME
jgi:hypothetical protein